PFHDAPAVSGVYLNPVPHAQRRVGVVHVGIQIPVVPRKLRLDDQPPRRADTIHHDVHLAVAALGEQEGDLTDARRIGVLPRITRLPPEAHIQFLAVRRVIVHRGRGGPAGHADGIHDLPHTGRREWGRGVNGD